MLKLEMHEHCMHGTGHEQQGVTFEMVLYRGLGNMAATQLIVPMMPIKHHRFGSSWPSPRASSDWGSGLHPLCILPRIQEKALWPSG